MTVDEIVIGINVGLGHMTINSCPLLDTNGDGGATIGELVVAVTCALGGC